MVVVNIDSNKQFIINTVQDPIQVDPESLVSMEISNLCLTITTGTRRILVPDKVVVSSLFSVVGISGLLKRNILEEGDIPESLKGAFLNVLKKHISSFLFFLDQDSISTVAILPLFDKGEPISVDDPASCKCTYHFPCETNGLSVLDFDHHLSQKVFNFNVIRTGDDSKPYFPVSLNKSSIAWHPTHSSWEQRGAIYAKDFGLYLIIPRLFSKNGEQDARAILDHLDTIISQIDLEADYTKEFEEMLTAKFPLPAKTFMQEAAPEVKTFGNILKSVSEKLQGKSHSLSNGVCKCLGYILVKKLHSCSECRHLDEDTI